MPELSIPYSIVGPDGTRIVLGAGAAAQADSDWVGFLDPANPISISRPLRGDSELLVQADGAIAADRYHGPASIVLRGELDPNAASYVAIEEKVKRATRALRGDAILTFTPTGLLQRAYWLRRSADPDFQGRRPRTVQLAFESANAYGMSPTEQATVILPGASAGELGFGSPISSPLGSPLNVAGAGAVVNAGTVETWPRFRIAGPITNPRIRNETVGLEARFTYTLAAGEFLDVYPALGRVILGGVTDRYSAFDRANSRWWQLKPGSNDVRLLAAGYSAGAQLTVYHRHAWE